MRVHCWSPLLGWAEGMREPPPNLTWHPPTHPPTHACLRLPLRQGGLDERLREVSLQGLVARDTPGYAIGGLAGGEDKSSFVQ